MGPLWAGGAGTKGDIFTTYYAWLAVPSGLLLLVMVSVSSLCRQQISL